MSFGDVDILAEGLDFPEGPIALEDGSVLLVEIAAQCLTRVFPDGRKAVVAHTGGGPNGAAIGPDGAVYIANNGGFNWIRQPGHMRANGQADDYSGGRIERVDLKTGRVDILYTHAGDVPLKGPNDLVFDSHGGFYFSDLGKVRPRDLDRGAVYYAKADGSLIRQVVFPISLPNGVGLSPGEEFLYVAETETARVWRFRVLEPGVLERLPYPSPNGGAIMFGAGGYQRFDSLKIDSAGNICVATLNNGGITIIPPEGGTSTHLPMPDDHTTNLCFGAGNVAYVTLGGTGRLARIKWPRAGLPLNYNTLANTGAIMGVPA